MPIEAFVWLDDRILSFFTKFSHRFQQWTGRTNFFLAELCLWLAGAGWFLAAPPLGVGMILVVGPIVRGLRHAERSLQEASPALDPAILRVRAMHDSVIGLPVRLVIMAIAVRGIFFFLDPLPWPLLLLGLGAVAGNFFTLFFCYFCLVLPLPPGKSKVREFIESLQAGFKLQPAPSPST